MFVDYVRVIDEIFSQFGGTRFSVRLWDGTERTYGKGSKKQFTLVFKRQDTVKRLLAEGSIGFGESYMNGSLTIEGDIEAYLRLRHELKHFRRTLGMTKAGLIAKLKMPKERQDQIAHHYDLGNDFFSMFLDAETMSYSAGRYITGKESLAEAQLNKLELVCSWLDLPKKAKVLDLGSGWGGFAKFAAQNHGWDITGYTLSKAQLNYCRQLIKQHKLEKHAAFRYRDMTEPVPNAAYDAIVMLESIEHVSKDMLARQFRNIYTGLKPGGSVYIQVSGQYKRHAVDRWTLKHVFPGGYLPPIYEIMEAAGEAGFVVKEFRDDTLDYLRTLPVWIEQLERNKEEVEKKFDESFFRLWQLWTHGAKVGFEVNYINLFRIQFKKPV